MKSYTTAAKVKAEKDTPDEGLIKFEIDGTPVTAKHPGEAMIALAIVRTGRRSTQAEVVAASIDFFFSVLDRKSARYVEDRLFDNEDDFDFDNVIEILYDLIEEWTGRPIERPSDS